MHSLGNSALRLYVQPWDQKILAYKWSMLINEARPSKQVTKIVTVQCRTVHLFAFYSIVETTTDSFVMYIV